MRTHTLTAAARHLVLSTCTCLAPLGAADAQPGVSGPWHTQVYIENDSRGAGTDEYYTHGTKLEFGRVGWSAGLGRHVFRNLDACRSEVSAAECYVERLRFALGQNMYTPGDLSRADRIVGDRPYGGWLYVEARAEAASGTRGNGFDLHRGRQWGVGASAGVVGPSSQADTIQRWWHKSVVNAQRPEGWSHQLSDRPAFMLMGEVKQRFADLGSRDEAASSRIRYFDAIGEAGVALGNVMTAARLGGTLRAGFNVGDDFGPSYITPAPPPPPAPPGDPSQPPVPGAAPRYSQAHPARARPAGEGSLFSLYGFVALEGRAVAYNVFLDAEADRYQIERRPWVGDFSWGGVLRICTFTFNYRRVNRGPEFDPGGRSHHYDAFSLTYSPRCRA